MPVSFKLPAGALKGWILLLLLLNAGLLVHALATGQRSMAGAPFFTLMLAVGVCFQVRFCAWILIFLLTVQALAVFMRDVVAAERWIRLLKVGLNLWLTYLLFQWLRAEEADAD